MLKGKIKVIKEDALQEESKNFHILQEVLFKVLGTNPSEVIFSGRHQKDDIINVGVIIVIGEFILNDLLGLKGIVRHAGTIQSYRGIPVVPIVSPGYLEYNPNYLQTYVEHIQKACYIAMGVEQEKVSNEHIIVDNINQVRDLVKYCKQTGYCSFDFETTELTDMSTFDPDFYCTTLSISFQQGSSYVIPLYHDESPFNEHDIDEIFKILETGVFGNPDIIKVGQNIKFDMHCLAWNGVTKFFGPYHDTMVLHHLYNEIPSHKLKDMVREMFSQFANYETGLGKKDWSKIKLEDLARYNALDSDLTLRIYWLLIGYFINHEERLYLMFRNCIAPATKVLFNMEETGMLVDKAFLVDAIRKVSGFIAEQEEKMRSHKEVIEYERVTNEYAVKEKINELYAKIAKDENAVFKSKAAQENQAKRLLFYKEQIRKLQTGEIRLELESVNFNSPDQLKELLFSSNGFKLEAPLDAYKRKNDSTGADNLDLIKDKTGFLEELKIYRQLQKILSTYLKSILDKLDCNHKVHTTFHQHGTKTGRLSARNPNLQNVISRTKYKVVEESVAMVKQAFIVPEGYTMVQADYSQIELRVIAYFAQEDTMLRAYATGQDLHELTAANSHGYTIEQFKALPEKEYKKLRFQAKAENFGYCLHPNTKIVTNKGVLDIQDVKIGDQVLTHKNNWDFVVNKQKLISKYLYEITTVTGKKVLCTPDHMWLCSFPSANGLPSRRGWVETQDLEENMFLTYNSNGFKSGTLHLDSTIALLLGWFLSEGCLSGNTFKISQSKTKNYDVYKKMESILIPFGFIAKSYPQYNSYYFRCPNKIYKEKLEGLIDFTLKSKDKNFSNIVYSLDRESVLLLLGALWDGDGTVSYRKRKKYTVTFQYFSISIELLNNIQYCLHSLGINSKIYKYPKSRANVLHVVGVESKMKFLSIIPTVKIDRNIKVKNSLVRNNWSCEEKIISIKKIEYNKTVYDLTVLNDHSFIANNLITHNCYGISPKGFKEYSRTDYGIDISLKEAERLRASYFNRYSKLPKYHNDYIQKARKFKYVRTFLGRKIHLPEIDSENRAKMGHAERNAINSPIQGTAGELTIWALVLLSIRLPEDILIVNTIHDSVIFYCPTNKLKEYITKIQNIMENLPLKQYFNKEIDTVPIKVEFECSDKNWKNLK